MKVALIGDVHANLPALEAVLADARERGVEAVWNVGDFVGYGAFPEEAVQKLREEAALNIIGNYDQKVLKVKEKKDKWKHSKLPEKWFAFNWAYDNLSESSREYLASLPEEIRLEESEKRILLTHGSPVSNEEHLAPDTTEERLQILAEMAEADIIISGHSHQPFKRKVNGVWFINTGSVGRPNDGDPRACYAIMQLKEKFFQLRHYRIEYDVEKAANAVREKGLPEVFAQMFTQGQGLDAVLETVKTEQAKEAIQAPAPDFEPDNEIVKTVLDLAESCEYDMGHTHQVTRLALKLFDELKGIHYLSSEERFRLRIGSLLHDIGWVEGQKGHHKTALHIILDTSLLPFDHQERLIIGSIARYHRKALPSKKHSHFAALKQSERRVVSLLAGILRVADGLDRTHQNLIEDLSCEINQDQIIIRCSVSRPADIECQVALKKGKLLEKALKRSLVIECQHDTAVEEEE